MNEAEKTGESQSVFSPELDDLLNASVGSKPEWVVDAPGVNSSHKVTMGLLWSDDEIRALHRAAERSISWDNLTRAKRIQVEILFESIKQIDDKVYESEDKAQHLKLKAELRLFLNHTSPAFRDWLYKEYRTNEEMAAHELAGRISQLKKSLEPEPSTPAKQATTEISD